jgi:hypothetical protein
MLELKITMCTPDVLTVSFEGCGQIQVFIRDLLELLRCYAATLELLRRRLMTGLKAHSQLITKPRTRRLATSTFVQSFLETWIVSSIFSLKNATLPRRPSEVTQICYFRD